MGAYLSIISGAIKLFNAVAAALQQHHDEVNGQNKVIAADNAQAAKVNENVAKAAVSNSDTAALGELLDGRG